MAKRRKKYKNQDDLIIGCYGVNCDRYKNCYLYYVNVAKEHPDMKFPIASYDKIIHEYTGDEEMQQFPYFCGMHGNYRMFKEYIPVAEALTLGEMKEKCKELKSNCDKCNLKEICFKNFKNNLPINWELED